MKFEYNIYRNNDTEVLGYIGDTLYIEYGEVFFTPDDLSPEKRKEELLFIEFVHDLGMSR